MVAAGLTTHRTADVGNSCLQLSFGVTKKLRMKVQFTRNVARHAVVDHVSAAIYRTAALEYILSIHTVVRKWLITP